MVGHWGMCAMPATVRRPQSKAPLSPASRAHTEGEVKDTSGKTQRVAAASPLLRQTNARDVSMQSGQGQQATRWPCPGVWLRLTPIHRRRAPGRSPSPGESGWCAHR